MKICPNCSAQFADSEVFCSRCGTRLVYQPAPPRFDNGVYYDRNNPFDACGPEGKSRGVAALLAILIGTLGIQYFYLGKTTAGLLSILISLCTCGLWQIITIIQGVMMFCMTNDEFELKYVKTQSSFPLF